MRQPSALAVAIEHTKTILLSNYYRSKFVDLVPECERNLFDAALEETYHIKLLSKKSVIVACCCVHRLDEPNTIFINPLLLHNLVERELTNSALVEDQTVFLVVKLVHEMSHLLHLKLSPSMQSRKVTLTKSFDDAYKIKCGDRKDPVVVQIPVDYTDFGEMIEKEVFGGLVELQAELPKEEGYMDLKRVGIYSSLKTLYGNYVDGTQTLENFSKGIFAVVQGEEFTSMKTPGNTRMLKPDSDINDRTTEEEEEEEEGFVFHRDPTGNTCM